MSNNKKQAADLIISAPAMFDGENMVSGELNAVAVKGNRIIACGKKEDIEHYAGGSTVIKHYDRGLLMPGLFDCHIHLMMGALSEEIVNLHESKSEEDAAKMVHEYASVHPEHEWILGFSWYHIMWDNKNLPSKASLDKYLPDRPVFLFNAEYHGAWVNSKALEICGITRKTPDPPFGRIQRDADGEATGFLYETAMGLAKKALDLPSERSRSVLDAFLKKAASLGITSVSDMFPLPGMELGDLDTYSLYEKEQKLTARIFFQTVLDGNLTAARSYRQKYTSDMLKFSGLKQFVDGVSTTYTAYMVEPYSDCPETRGGTLIPEDYLYKWVTDADREGFRVRLHSCGDGSLRLALDCYEEAAKINGKRDSRHVVEHCEIIHPDDIGRFAALGVVNSFQPEAIAITHKFEDNPYPLRTGPDREKYTFVLRSIFDTGAHMAFGTDYPVVDLDPFPGIYRAVTRVFNDGNPAGGWIPQEKITMLETLRAYTCGSSWMSFMENDLGLIRPGYLADMIVLDRDLFTVDTELIRDTKVLLTVNDGRIIWQL